MNILKPVYLFPLIIIALWMGLSGGWARLGYVDWNFPHTASNHGLLMVGGFLGTLLSLERSMVMKNQLWLIVPMISGLSVPVTLLGWPTVGPWMLFIASLGLVAIMYVQTLRFQLPHVYIMALGAVSWMLGNFVFLYSDFMAMATGWWMAFLLLTILGERLELSKFLPTPKLAKKALSWLVGIFFIGLLLPFHGMGSKVLGSTLVLISLWLLYFDMAKIAVQKVKQFKYIGLGLRVGYFWLFINGIILISLSNHNLYYDLYLHTFFLGFTFSMIWAHAPIILPMLLGLKITPYHPVLWAGWALFQFSLMGRILFSFLDLYVYRNLFGMINGWSILIMFALMASVVLIRYVKFTLGMDQEKEKKVA